MEENNFEENGAQVTVMIPDSRRFVNGSPFKNLGHKVGIAAGVRALRSVTHRRENKFRISFGSQCPTTSDKSGDSQNQSRLLFSG